VGPKRVLSIAPWVPSGNARYAGQRYLYQHLYRMAQDFDVTLLSSDTEANRNLSLEETPWQIVLVPSLRTPSGVRAEIAALRLQGRGEPIPNLIEYATSFVESPDVVELQWSTTMCLAPIARKIFPSAYVAAFQYDRYSATLTWKKLRRLRFRRRLRDVVAGRIIAQQERRLARSCDLVAAFKQADVDFVDKRSSTLVVDPWLEEPAERIPNSDTMDVVFVGAFSREENVEGAFWMIDRVMPLVIAEHPTARLVLAGAGPGPDLCEREGPGVHLTGFVDDLGPYYQAAHCCVSPIFSGGGLRFKVPQALSYGVPMVVTSESLAGLEGLPQTSLAGVEDEPSGFAAAICKVLQDPITAAVAAAEAQRWVRARFSFDRTVESVLSAYRTGKGNTLKDVK
jgi:glycosyltransferase involved in cell wall biosynthesis